MVIVWSTFVLILLFYLLFFFFFFFFLVLSGKYETGPSVHEYLVVKTEFSNVLNWNRSHLRRFKRYTQIAKEKHGKNCKYNNDMEPTQTLDNVHDNDILHSSQCKRFYAQKTLKFSEYLEILHYAKFH